MMTIEIQVLIEDILILTLCIVPGTLLLLLYISLYALAANYNIKKCTILKRRQIQRLLTKEIQSYSLVLYYSARVATFSLTNSVPQDPCFNRIVWYGIESDTKERMEKYCSFSKAKRYIITGAVPSANESIPSKDILIGEN